MILGSTISPNHFTVLEPNAVSCLHLRKHATLYKQVAWVRLLWARCRIRFKVCHAAARTGISALARPWGFSSLGKNSWKSSDCFYSPQLSWGQDINPLKIHCSLEASLVFSVDTNWESYCVITCSIQPTLRGHTMAEKLVLLEPDYTFLGALQTWPPLSTCHSFPYSASSLSFLNGSCNFQDFSVWTSMTLSVCVDLTPCLCDW